MERTYDHSQVLRVSDKALGVIPVPRGEAVAIAFQTKHPGSQLGNTFVVRISPDELADLEEQIAEFKLANPDMFPDRGTNWTPYSAVPHE